MTELARPVMPPAPEPSPIVARYFELYRAYHDPRTSLDHLVSREQKREQPNPDLIGRLDPEQWRYSDSHPEIRFSQAERLAELERRAEARIAEIHQHIENARALSVYLDEHRAEIEAYKTAQDDWRDECARLESEYYEAKNEAYYAKKRATYVVGNWVRPPRARNYWEIIAREGKGGIIREKRNDGKPARIREVADILEVA